MADCRRFLPDMDWRNHLGVGLFPRTPGTAGWVIGGILGVITAAGVSVILYELRRAIEMPDRADSPQRNHTPER